jgi:hypothetical protein
MTKKLWMVGLMATVGVACLMVFGCSSKNTVDNEIPTGSVISVSASPTSVETSETSVVEATVTANSVGIADQVIYFSVSPSSAGTVTPQYDTTEADGVAATVFTASQAGAVVVQAQIVGTAISSSVGLSVSQGSAGSGNVNVSASRSLLLANGHDTSEVTVVVRDELGQPAPDGTLIKLIAGEKFLDRDGNGYWSANIDSLLADANGNGNWDSYGLIPSTVTVSGGAGQATVDYISGDDAYTIYIKVTVDDNGIQGYAELSLQLSPNTVLYSIYLASDSVTLSVAQTGGIETAILRATGYDTHGNPVPEGMPIVFAILDGPGGGEQVDTVGYGPDTAYTNNQGMAATTISSGTVSGTVRIRAYFGTVLSNATQVLIAAGPPEYIEIGSSVCNTQSWNRVGDSVGILAIVSDVYLNPVNDSTVVYFRCDEGVMKATENRTMHNNGHAVSWWYSGKTVPTADGVVRIYAETSGGTVLDSSLFYNSWTAATLTITSWQASILADGSRSFTAEIAAADGNGNFVINGTTFEGEAIFLNVAGGSFSDGCYGAAGSSRVTSVVLDRDWSTTGANDNGIGAIDTVKYWTKSGASVMAECALLTGPAYSSKCEITGPTSAVPGEQVRLSVKVADRWGNPLGDHTMNITASGGVVTGGTQETDTYGEAYGFIWTAPALDGDYNIVVTDTDPLGSGMVLTKKITVKAPV